MEQLLADETRFELLQLGMAVTLMPDDTAERIRNAETEQDEHDLIELLGLAALGMLVANKLGLVSEEENDAIEARFMEITPDRLSPVFEEEE